VTAAAESAFFHPRDGRAVTDANQTGAARSVRLGRRGLLAALGATVVGAAAPTAVAARGQSRPVWPLFQYDRTNTGAAGSVRGPREAAGARWTYDDGGSFTTTPVVTEDAVFAVDEGGDAVVALDRSSGERRWLVDADVRTARMTYADGRLFVPADDLQVRSAADGSRQWRARVDGARSVLVRGDFAFVAGLAGVARVSLTSQSVDWAVDDPTQVQPLAVDDERVYAVGSQFGRVFALDPASGGARWQQRLEGGATGAPTRAAGRVFVPTDAVLGALSPESGTVDWTFGEGVGSSVAVADGSVFATTAGGDVVALDPASGDEQWRNAAGVGSNPPIVAGGLLYVTGADGRVLAMTTGDGAVVWEAAVGGARSANVAAGGGELYAGDEDGRLVALAAGAGGRETDTATATETSTPEPTPSPTATPENDEPAAETSPTSTSGPGFGLAAGAAALGGAALAARRWRSAGDGA